jgi:hypothetical protein
MTEEKSIIVKKWFFFIDYGTVGLGGKNRSPLKKKLKKKNFPKFNLGKYKSIPNEKN